MAVRAAPSIAKLTRPRLHRVLERRRLFTLLDERGHSPVVWIAGPPGAGKTALAASYVAASKRANVWYQVDRGD